MIPIKIISLEIYYPLCCWLRWKKCFNCMMPLTAELRDSKIYLTSSSRVSSSSSSSCDWLKRNMIFCRMLVTKDINASLYLRWENEKILHKCFFPIFMYSETILNLTPFKLNTFLNRVPVVLKVPYYFYKNHILVKLTPIQTKYGWLSKISPSLSYMFWPCKPTMANDVC